MRFFDISGKEVESVDYTNYLPCQDFMFTQEFGVDDEVKVPAVLSYVSAVEFEDGSQYVTTGPDDENVSGFVFVPFGEFEDKQVKSYHLRSFISLEDYQTLRTRPWTQIRRLVELTEDEKNAQSGAGGDTPSASSEEVQNLKEAMASLQEAFV